MIFNVFNTLEEAKFAQQYDFEVFISKKSGDYATSTHLWAEIFELNGKFYYTPCPQSDKVYTTDELCFEENV